MSGANLWDFPLLFLCCGALVMLVLAAVVGAVFLLFRDRH